MPSISSAELRVELLDPTADATRLGPRYCWAGYIWQVWEATRPLLTGPEWPKSDPLPFNGQGLPESFRHRTRDGRNLTWRDGRGVALGAGELAPDASGEVQVIRPCPWVITTFSDRIDCHTHQQAVGLDYELVRKVSVAGRRVRSETILTNHGTETIALEWFAHPFFALTDRLIEVEFPPASSLPENPGFTLTGRHLAQKRRFAHEKDGHMDIIRLPGGLPLSARLTHPVLSHVDLHTRFVPSECVIWGNSNTFSIEPYLAIRLEPDQSQSWSLVYEFGRVKAATRSD